MEARRAFTALLAALALLCACSREPDLPAPSPALWEVSGPNGEHGYLFGTVHALPPSLEWRSPVVDSAFDQAATLIVEVDLDTADQEVFWALARTPGLGPPSHRVDPDKREIAAALLERSGYLDRDAMEIESWAAALLVAGGHSYGESEFGADRDLISRGRSKQIVELEGYSGQLSIFDNLPEAEQVDMLEIVVTETRTAMQTDFAESERQVLAWRAGDTGALESALETGLLADPELREALLVKRNLAWAEQVGKLLHGGKSVFVAVGAAHMLGTEGLVALLQKRGYRVTRIQ